MPAVNEQMDIMLFYMWVYIYTVQMQNTMSYNQIKKTSMFEEDGGQMYFM